MKDFARDRNAKTSVRHAKLPANLARARMPVNFRARLAKALDVRPPARPARTYVKMNARAVRRQPVKRRVRL